MNLLKDRIRLDGENKDEGIIKVDSFLNHQIDVDLLDDIGREFYNRFKDENIDKIVTIEASGIAIAVMAARYFKVPVVFAKKTESKNLDKDTYEADVFSYTKGKSYTIRISKRYLKEGENILIVDDFMARGKASEGLIKIVEEAKCRVKGIGIVIEKGFQDGGKNIMEKGYRLESLAVVETIKNGNIVFR